MIPDELQDTSTSEEEDVNASTESSTVENEGAEDSSSSEGLLDAIIKNTETDLKFEEDEDVLDDSAGDTPTPEEKVEADKAEAEQKTEGEPELPDGLSQEEFKTYGKGAQARIKELVSKHNEATQYVQSLQSELNVVKPYIDFMQQHDIPQQDLDVVLGLTAALRKGDFRAFLEGVSPYVELAQQYTGQVLPPDLHQQVQEGYVSQEIAHELAARRANEAIMTNQSRQTHERLQQERAQANSTSIRNAITNWEQQKAAADPDYSKKADLVKRTAQAIMQEHGGPQSPQQAIEMAEAAYREATDYVNRLQPVPRPTRRTPSGFQNSSTRATAEPGSLMEAALAGLRAVRE